MPGPFPDWVFRPEASWSVFSSLVIPFAPFIIPMVADGAGEEEFPAPPLSLFFAHSFVAGYWRFGDNPFSSRNTRLFITTPARGLIFRFHLRRSTPDQLNSDSGSRQAEMKAIFERGTYFRENIAFHRAS